jgi:hypothetical protein
MCPKKAPPPPSQVIISRSCMAKLQVESLGQSQVPGVINHRQRSGAHTHIAPHLALAVVVMVDILYRRIAVRVAILWVVATCSVQSVSPCVLYNQIVW